MHCRNWIRNWKAFSNSAIASVIVNRLSRYSILTRYVRGISWHFESHRRERRLGQNTIELRALNVVSLCIRTIRNRKNNKERNPAYTHIQLRDKISDISHYVCTSLAERLALPNQVLLIFTICVLFYFAHVCIIEASLNKESKSYYLAKNM